MFSDDLCPPCRRLRVLKADHNGIDGQLRPEISSMESLQIVHLHKNRLVGSPQVLLDGTLRELKVSHAFHYNSLLSKSP